METMAEQADKKTTPVGAGQPAAGETEEVAQGLVARLKRVADQLTTGQKVGAALVALATFGGLLWIAMSASQTEYRTLYSGLSGEQSSQIVESLQERQIPYELSAQGISVPSDQLHEARIFLAGQGLPKSEGIGFELFDKNEFGMTAFTQKVNYQRAMENELARTIRSIDAVEQARVHLVISERALFQEDQEPSTASVIVTMRPGTDLNSGQIRSMRHLVAGAVEGMDPRDIAVVDSTGEMLAKPRSEEMLGGTGTDGEEMKAATAMERQYEERIVELLAPLVGAKNVRAKVSVELDTKRITETAEIYDPDKTAVRREQRSEESNLKGEAAAAGAAGAATQLTGQPNAGETASVSTQRLNEVVDYEINKRVRQTTEGGTRIKRLSVAVLVDDTAPVTAAPDDADAAVTEGEEGEDAEAKPADAIEAGAAATLSTAALESLVKSAVGFDPARGDQLEVMKERFRPVTKVAPEPLPWWQEPMFVAQAVRYGALLLLAIMLLLFVVRPMMSTMREQLAAAKAREEAEAMGDGEVVGKTIAQLEGEMHDGAEQGLEVLDSQDELDALLDQTDPLRDHQRQLRAEVLEISEDDLDRTSQVISQWIRVG